MAKTKESSNPNKDLGLEKFDYSSMDGSTKESKQLFEEYKEVENKLQLNTKYDFEIWNATTVRKFTTDENSGEKVAYIGGIILQKSKPIQKTRITAQAAHEINKHASFLKDNTYTATSRYCLLAKPESE